MTALLSFPRQAALTSKVIPFTPTFAMEEDALVCGRGEKLDSWQSSFQALETIATLQDDWDGDGALAPQAQLRESARELLIELRQRNVPAPSRVAAGPNGTILMEWQNGLNYFEIEVCAPGALEWMAAVPEFTRHGKAIDQNALNLLAWILSLR